MSYIRQSPPKAPCPRSRSRDSAGFLVLGALKKPLVRLSSFQLVARNSMRMNWKWAPLILALMPFAVAGKEDAKPAYASELGEAVPNLSDEADATFARG